MLGPIKAIKLLRDYRKLQSIMREKISMNKKTTQIVALVVTVIGTFGLATYAQNWVDHNTTVFGVLVALAQILHALFPSIFAAPATKKDKTASFLIVAVLLTASATSLRAQEVPAASNGFSASSDALAVDYAGSWSAGTLVSESFDLIDLGKTKANRIYVQGNQFLAPTPGYSLYTGGIRFEPNLFSLLAKTNVPVGSLGLFVDGSVGSGTASSGPAHIAWLAGGGVKYALTKSLTWQSLEVQYGAVGAQRLVGISTGLSFIFGR